MEFEGKANALFFSTVPSKTLDHHCQHMIAKPQVALGRDPHPDPKPEPDPDPDPAPAPVSTSPPTPPSPPAVSAANRAIQGPSSTRGEHTARYRECQKNHAVVTGGLVIDGCGEFMPGGEEGTPEALKCAACGCHRSFHRKEIGDQDTRAAYWYAERRSKHPVTPTLHCSSSCKVMQAHAMHRTAEIERREENRAGEGKGSRKKKRFRTKINQEQKDKMKEFAERLGWSLQKKDEEEVDRFCSMVNLRREVFKVWMHNNKQSMKRKLTLPN